jgi:hypothetical protein
MPHFGTHESMKYIDMESIVSGIEFPTRMTNMVSQSCLLGAMAKKLRETIP